MFYVGGFFVEEFRLDRFFGDEFARLRARQRRDATHPFGTEFFHAFAFDHPSIPYHHHFAYRKLPAHSFHHFRKGRRITGVAAIHPDRHWLALFALVMPALAIAADAGAEAAAGALSADTTPWYLSAGFFSSVIAFVTSVLAIWQGAGKKTAQKVSETLVVAIEEASKIPAVAEHEEKIKAKIREVNERYHIEPVVNALVKKLT
jgi:hypothetical protein